MGILSRAVSIFIQLVSALILVRVLMSWFRPRYRTRSNSWFYDLEEMIWRATEPLLAPIRNLIPVSSMGLDFSPLILLLLIELVGRLLVGALVSIGL
ncbi:MAG TPA: YggT family protein [Symbiobacteriaceae bacterium]